MIKEPFYIFTFLVFVIIVWNFTLTTKESFGETSAAEACKTIASEADKIKAGFDGAAKVIGQISPFALIANAIKGGENNVDSETRNIIEENMSSETRMNITNECKNSSATMQLNEIDTSQCKYCQEHGCDASNITQENNAEAEQKCILASAVTSLMKQSDNIKAQALAQAIQKSQGLSSGDNASKGKSCNVIKKDMSQKQYIEVINKCTNEITTNQTNSLKNCGPMTNIVQRNVSKQLQTCITDGTVDAKAEQDSSTDATAKSKSDQTSVGFDPSQASLSSALVSCVCCLALAGVLVFAMQGGSSIKDYAQAYKEVAPDIKEMMKK